MTHKNLTVEGNCKLYLAGNGQKIHTFDRLSNTLAECGLFALGNR